MRYARAGWAHRAEREGMESEIIWAQYATVPNLLAAHWSLQVGRWRWWGGSRQHPAGGGRSKRRERKRASSVSAAACGCNYEGQARSCCIGIAIPVLVFSGYRLATAIALVACQCQAPQATDSWSEHSWRLQQKATLQLEWFFFSFSLSHLLFPSSFSGYFPCLIPDENSRTS
jgi:hypothetical protein